MYQMVTFHAKQLPRWLRLSILMPYKTKYFHSINGRRQINPSSGEKRMKKSNKNIETIPFGLFARR